jgi:hypothetical protein
VFIHDARILGKIPSRFLGKIPSRFLGKIPSRIFNPSHFDGLFFNYSPSRISLNFYIDELAFKFTSFEGGHMVYT